MHQSEIGGALFGKEVPYHLRESYNLQLGLHERLWDREFARFATTQKT